MDEISRKILLDLVNGQSGSGKSYLLSRLKLNFDIDISGFVYFQTDGASELVLKLSPELERVLSLEGEELFLDEYINYFLSKLC